MGVEINLECKPFYVLKYIPLLSYHTKSYFLHRAIK